MISIIRDLSEDLRMLRDDGSRNSSEDVDHDEHPVDALEDAHTIWGPRGQCVAMFITKLLEPVAIIEKQDCENEIQGRTIHNGACCEGSLRRARMVIIVPRRHAAGDNDIQDKKHGVACDAQSHGPFALPTVDRLGVKDGQ